MLQKIEDTLRKFAGKVDYLEARIEESAGTSIVLRGREIDTIRDGLSQGGCVRAIHKGGVGFTSFNNIEKLSEFAAKAVEQARTVGSGVTKLAPAPVIKAQRQAKIAQDPRSVPVTEKLAMLKAYNDIILSFDKRIPTSSVGYSDGFRKIWYGNAEGTRLYYEKLDIGCNMSAVAVADGQTQFGSTGFGSSTDYAACRGHEEAIRRECRAALDMLIAKPVKGGSYTAILDQHLGGVFAHEAFGHMSEGEKVAYNPKLAEVMKLGRAFGRPILNIFDTGLTPGTRGAIAFDEEGVESRRTDLIKDGLLVGRLHTRETAGRMGEQATGSARAMNHQFPPVPRMRNTCIAPGTSTFEEMISDVKLGIYAVKAMGGQAGEMFTFTPARCFMIRDGKVEEMVKNAILSGNLFTTLKNIDMIAGDFKQQDAGGGCGKGTPDGFQFPLPVSDGAPHFRIRDVVIGGT